MRDNLTELEAAARERRVSNVDYALSLSLGSKQPTYRGTLTATFDAKPGEGPIFLDFTGTKLESVELNGARIDKPDWNGTRLALPEKLIAAKNTLAIGYENEYSHTGSGFHRFIDPEDGREYVYSDFEPFNAHRLFPCFDQPDLKASYRVSVTAPENFVVVSNGRELETTKTSDGRVQRIFKRTTRFSTYISAVIAGEYAVYEDRAGDIPLRILCRKALTKFIDPEEIFTVTKQGFDFYQSFFDSPYPFEKYDQIFVPEFNMGAMENVAAVTHGEHMIFRGQISETQRLNRAETVLHELAHMWFGNLVTMKWWNDLWLNESFATFISYLCMTKATRFKHAWESFHSKIKAWAMRQDELVTTHPIAGSVPDTDATFLNFDGITYGKGASVLKQLTAYIGEDAFRDGLRRYFKRHAWRNTTLDDFLAALEEGSGRDLRAWSRAWIETSGLGSLGAKVERVNGKIASFAVEQEPASVNDVLRPHRIDVALFGEDARIAAVAPVLVEGKRTDVKELRGKPAPSFVAVNHGDHAYAKVVLDPASLEFVREKLERIDEPLVKATLWGTLWQMVRDQKLAAADYVELVAAKAQHETQPEIVETLIANATTALVRFLGVPGGLGPRELEPLERRGREALVARAWSRLRETNGDMQLTWLRATIALAREPGDLDRLVRLMDGAEKIDGVTIDQEMRWNLIAKLVAYARPSAEERLAAEKTRDPSDKGKKSAFGAEASRPSAGEKERHWQLFVRESELSSDFLKNGMSRFHWSQQAALLDPFVGRFFDDVGAIFEKRSPEYAKAFCLLLYPTYRAEPDVVARGEQLASRVAHPQLKRMLREANDELARGVRCRAFQSKSAR